MSSSNKTSTYPNNSSILTPIFDSIGFFCVYLLIALTYLVLFILINDAIFDDENNGKMNMLCDVKYGPNKIDVICNNDNNIRADIRPYRNKINNKYIFAFIISLIGTLASLYIAKSDDKYILPSAGVMYGSYLIPIYYLSYYWYDITDFNKIISIATYFIVIIYLSIGL